MVSAKSPQKRCHIFQIVSSCDLVRKTNLCNDALNDFKAIIGVVLTKTKKARPFLIMKIIFETASVIPSLGNSYLYEKSGKYVNTYLDGWPVVAIDYQI